jgi:hypothetical protein
VKCAIEARKDSKAGVKDLLRRPKLLRNHPRRHPKAVFRSKTSGRPFFHHPVRVFGEVVISTGSLYEAWRFVYEFALDNYRAEKLPELEVLLYNKRYHLVPKMHPEYVLVIGSEEEIRRCEKAIINLMTQCINSTVVGEIKTKAAELVERTRPFQTALSMLLGKSADDN